jgi:hypothetical protein
MDTGTGIPGGYAGMGTTGMGTGRVFCTHGRTRTRTRHTRASMAGIPYKYDGRAPTKQTNTTIGYYYNKLQLLQHVCIYINPLFFHHHGSRRS